MKRAGVVVIVVLVVLAVGAVAFWGGTKYAENRIAQNPALLFQRFGNRQGGQFFVGPQQRGQGQAQGQRPGGIQGGQFPGGTIGTVKSVEGDVLTLTTTNGDVQVKTSETTLIEKYMSVGLQDLKEGERLIVSGTKNEDGSITARSIQTMRAGPMDATGAQPTAQPETR